MGDLGDLGKALPVALGVPQLDSAYRELQSQGTEGKHDDRVAMRVRVAVVLHLVSRPNLRHVEGEVRAPVLGSQ